MGSVAKLREKYEQLDRDKNKLYVPPKRANSMLSADRMDEQLRRAKSEPISPRGSLSKRKSLRIQARKSLNKSTLLDTLDYALEHSDAEMRIKEQEEKWQKDREALIEAHHKEMEEREKDYKAQLALQTMRLAGSAWMSKAFGRKSNGFFTNRSCVRGNIFNKGELNVDYILLEAENELKQLYEDAYEAALEGVKNVLPGLLVGEDEAGIRSHMTRTITEQGLKALEEEIVLLQEDLEEEKEVEEAPAIEGKVVVIDGDAFEESLAEIIIGGSKHVVIKAGQLGLNDDQLLDLLTAVDQNPSIRELDLEGNDFESGYEQLADRLPLLTDLATLSLRWCMVDEVSAGHLGRGLLSCTQLVTLQLTGTQLCEGGNSLFPSLTSCTALESLYVGDNAIGDEGAQVLGNALEKHPSLVLLDVSNNDIGEMGARAISNMLKANQCLRMVVLSGNSLYDDGARSIAEAFPLNRTLTSIVLCNCSIGQVGVLEIARQLDLNGVIVEMDVTLNDPGIPGELALFDLCKARPSLSLVWKEAGLGCNYGDEEMREIISHMGLLRVLRKLLHGNALDPLISDADLIAHIRLPDMEVAEQFLEAVLHDDGFLERGMNIIAGILIALVDREADPLYQTLLSKLGEVVAVLKSVPQSLATRSLRMTFGEVRPPLGYRVPILHLLSCLLSLDDPAMDKALVEAGVFGALCEVVVAYPWNNIVHTMVLEVAVVVMDRGGDLCAQLLSPNGLFHTMYTKLKNEFRKPFGFHLGYVGHAIEMMRAAKVREEELANHLSALPGWQQWSATALQDILAEQQTWHCCPKPGRVAVDFISAEEMARREREAMASGAQPT